MLAAAILSQERGLACRNGRFCAHPYMTRVLASQGGATPEPNHTPGAVRASFGLYNTEIDVERLVEAVDMIRRGRFRGRYSINRRGRDRRGSGTVQRPLDGSARTLGLYIRRRIHPHPRAMPWGWAGEHGRSFARGCPSDHVRNRSHGRSDRNASIRLNSKEFRHVPVKLFRRRRISAQNRHFTVVSRSDWHKMTANVRSSNPRHVILPWH